MEAKRKGWIIINENHPNNPNKEILYPETFAYTKKDCIAKFTNETTFGWKYWREKYNYKASKCELTINTPTRE